MPAFAFEPDRRYTLDDYKDDSFAYIRITGADGNTYTFSSLSDEDNRKSRALRGRKQGQLQFFKNHSCLYSIAAQKPFTSGRNCRNGM